MGRKLGLFIIIIVNLFGCKTGQAQSTSVIPPVGASNFDSDCSECIDYDYDNLKTAFLVQRELCLFLPEQIIYVDQKSESIMISGICQIGMGEYFRDMLNNRMDVDRDCMITQKEVSDFSESVIQELIKQKKTQITGEQLRKLIFPVII